MRGKTDEEILEEREKAVRTVEYILGEKVEILNSFVPIDGEVNNPLKCLSESISILADADVAYFADGWKDARGCRIEHECAVQYEIGMI